jgi:hypothetical protein
MSWVGADMGAHERITTAHLAKQRVMDIMISNSRPNAFLIEH